VLLDGEPAPPFIRSLLRYRLLLFQIFIFVSQMDSRGRSRLRHAKPLSQQDLENFGSFCAKETLTFLLSRWRNSAPLQCLKLSRSLMVKSSVIMFYNFFFFSFLISPFRLFLFLSLPIMQVSERRERERKKKTGNFAIMQRKLA